ncbi:GH1 family beta-glucosidase [Psychromicrobium sp. YIM B11713]|uniref:GH1 family beta-glucosidase n=1 Tax=Psychromicrobium sp. YIM B11713 TaxID=3145233 RepID=UPI00374F14CA
MEAEELALRVPKGFRFGVATAAFQIEGAVREDGRGLSGWDDFTRQPGRILNGDTADTADDHYHRVAEDLTLMKRLGVDAYRFSISWPRVIPDGGHRVNAAGLAFYDRLVDQLLEAGISPTATLYHWDTPLPLEQAGGWLNRNTAERLAEYASVLGSALGDRVDQWITLNEPATVTLLGYGLGVHAPGKALLFDGLPSAHHQLLAHGLAAQALRAAGVKGGIGVTNVHMPVVPASDSAEDALFAQLFDLLQNRIYADPVLLGHYPEVSGPLAEIFAALSEQSAEDLAIIHQPLDFYGLNYYAPAKIAAGGGIATGNSEEAAAMSGLPFRLESWPDHPVTAFDWPVVPEYFGVALTEQVERYGQALPPVYITENGTSCFDQLADGEVADQARIDYLAGHLAAAFEATAPGGPASAMDLRGYYCWSLLDNFEWAAGYSQRFGLVYVDFETLTRTPKKSYDWYRRLIAASR